MANPIDQRDITLTENDRHTGRPLHSHQVSVDLTTSTITGVSGEIEFLDSSNSVTDDTLHELRLTSGANVVGRVIWRPVSAFVPGGIPGRTATDTIQPLGSSTPASLPSNAESWSKDLVGGWKFEIKAGKKDVATGWDLTLSKTSDSTSVSWSITLKDSAGQTKYTGSVQAVTVEGLSLRLNDVPKRQAEQILKLASDVERELGHGDSSDEA